MSTCAIGVAQEDGEGVREVEEAEAGLEMAGFLARNVASLGIVAAASG